MATERWEAERLRRILFDDEYGPKLVHLSKRDQRKVLDILEQRGRSKPAEARKLIEKLDAERRENRNVRERVKRFAKKKRVERSRDRPRDETGQFWRLFDELGLSG